MGKKILIKAYTNTNLGDDLFVKMLCDRYPHHNFYIICKKSDARPFRNIKNLSIINPIPYIDSILSKMKFNKRVYNLLELNISKIMDAVIHIGGSLYIESNNSWSNYINHYKKLVTRSNAFFVLGCNFGPYESEWFPQKFKEIYMETQDVCFRDLNSYNEFSDLENVRLAPDIVFSLNENLVKLVNSGNYIIISVIDLSNRLELKGYQASYEQSIINISKKLISMNKKVVLMSFCGSEGDEKAIRRIKKKYTHNDLSYYFYKGNINESLSIIKSSDSVIATRFHSLILAWLFGKPAFPYVYSNKTLNLIGDVNFQGYFLPIMDIETIDIDRVVNQLTQENTQDISKEKITANNHFIKTDFFLNT